MWKRRLDFLLIFFLGYGFVVLDKERELGEAQTEIRALRLSERAREKAVEEVIAVSFVLDFVVQRYAFPVYLFVFPEMAISFALR